MVVPMAPNERWSLGFVSDQLACGRRFRILNVVDDYSRECVGQLVDVSISGTRMARYLRELGQARKLPASMESACGACSCRQVQRSRWFE